MQNGDYAKLGAYVQQDDILVDVLTPCELLEFACRMRTSLTEEEIKVTVSSIVTRLGLTACCNQ